MRLRYVFTPTQLREQPESVRSSRFLIDSVEGNVNSYTGCECGRIYDFGSDMNDEHRCRPHPRRDHRRHPDESQDDARAIGIHSGNFSAHRPRYDVDSFSYAVMDGFFRRTIAAPSVARIQYRPDLTPRYGDIRTGVLCRIARRRGLNRVITVESEATDYCDIGNPSLHPRIDHES